MQHWIRSKNPLFDSTKIKQKSIKTTLTAIPESPPLIMPTPTSMTAFFCWLQRFDAEPN